VAAALAGVVALAVAGVALAGSGRLDRFTATPSLTAQPQHGSVTSHFASSSGSGRYQFWKAAWKAFEQEPAHGIGAGAFESWWTRTRTIDFVTRDAHSWYLEALGELGIGGLLLTLGFVTIAAVGGLRRRLTGAWAASELGVALALLGAGALSAAIDWTWELPAAFLVPLVAVALLLGPATKQAAAPARWRRPAGVVTAVLACLAIALSAIGLALQVKLDDSRAAAKRGDLDEAAKAANAAIALEPWAAAPRLRLALIEERRGALRAALGSADEALARAPEDWRAWLATARIRIKSGNVRGAERALNRARRLNPRSPIFATGAK
jgi:tetratricopeptide (TPR) repeat protein